MFKHSIFASTLGISKPWKITGVEISSVTPRLDIHVSCNQSYSLPCPVCGKAAVICDSAEESWVHSDFFNKEAVLHARVPVFTCADKCGCYRLNTPWLNAGSRFTLIDRQLPQKCISCDKSGSITGISP